jgi:hypothetical protein
MSGWSTREQKAKEAIESEQVGCASGQLLRLKKADVGGGPSWLSVDGVLPAKA